MSKFQKYIFPLIRIIFYITFILYFTITPTEKFENGKPICLFFILTNKMCPACGVTRAFSSFLHLHFLKAFNYNPFFTVSVFPICLFLMIEDSFTSLKRIFNKQDKKSLLENLIV